MVKKVIDITDIVSYLPNGGHNQKRIIRPLEWRLDNERQSGR